MQQRELFPYNYLEVINHNITLLTNYYTQKQHLYYKNIAQAYFTPDQNRDTRFIPPPQKIPLTHISINECNLENDIKVSTNTIQTQKDVAHIYEDTRRHLITITDNRLEWLWKQYATAKNNHHGLIPPTQTFETEIVWLYQRYKYRIPKNNQLKFAQHTLPKPLLDYITTSFNITHSYLSSPVTCSTKITRFYSPFPRDKIFGSIGTAFQYKWKGTGYAHPHNIDEAQKSIHWTRLAAKNDPSNITIITIPDTNWYQNPNTHVVMHIPADTIIYNEPTIPPELNNKIKNH